MTIIKAKVVSFKLSPCPNSDNLSIAQIDEMAWQCIVRTADFQNQTLGVYIPIDAKIPVDRPEFSTFADKSKDGFFRIKTIRLRGTLSQGLLMPAPEGAKLGDDLTEQLGVQRWEPPIPMHFAGDTIRQPGNFCIYTSIENYKYFPNVFSESDNVRICEKLHGCLRSQTRIKLVNGETKYIRDVKIGDEVLGMDENGNLVPSKVLNTFYNGDTREWLKIKIKRLDAGKGASMCTVTCTPNHRFWVPTTNSYVEAAELSAGTRLLSHRFEITHTPIQEQVLLGTLLGDAYLSVKTNSAAVQFGHVVDDIEYFELKKSALGDLYSSDKGQYLSGYGSEMIRGATVYASSIKQKFESFIGADGKKIVPNWVTKDLTPLALAYWYMDDGSLSSQPTQEDRVNFAVCNFTKEDCEVLQQALLKFNINSVYYVSHNKNNNKDHSRLKLNADDAEKLFLIIAPYIPPCMQRKLPERYRGFTHWAPNGGLYKKRLVESEIISVEEYDARPAKKFDLETETHNFFANGVLVHNSNFRGGYVDEGKIDENGKSILQYIVGSHRTAKDKDGQNIYSEIARRLNLEEKFSILKEKYQPKTNFIIYGEIYGAKIQDLKYDSEAGTTLRIFDVMLDFVYQPWDTIQDVATALNVPTVPVLYRGPFSPQVTLNLRDGRTTLGGKHVREGVVVTAEPEGSHPKIGRKVLKYISDDYLLRKHATDF